MASGGDKPEGPEGTATRLKVLPKGTSPSSVRTASRGSTSGIVPSDRMAIAKLVAQSPEAAEAVVLVLTAEATSAAVPSRQRFAHHLLYVSLGLLALGCAVLFTPSAPFLPF